jgi:hypothetical protein
MDKSRVYGLLSAFLAIGMIASCFAGDINFILGNGFLLVASTISEYGESK